MIELRPYQSTWIEGIRHEFKHGRKRLVLGQLPTGGGKTVCFSYMAAGALSRGSTVWILAHRIELVEQISQSLKAFSVQHGFVAAGYPSRPYLKAHICSTQTLVRRMDSLQPPDFIIIDEAHHATRKNTLGRILSAYPRARVLGVTATPWRLSGEGMGEVFEALVIGPTVSELIEIGALSRPKVFAPATVDTSRLHTRGGDFIAAESSQLMDTRSVTGDVIDHYEKHARGRPFIAFTAGVTHARNVADMFTKAGYPSMHVDGGMDKYTRKRIIDDYRAHRLLGLTSCDLVSEGFDVPGIHCGIALRPTDSLTLWLQQLGRCLRICEGKDGAVILDHVGNTLRHGLPTDEREWSLAGRERATKGSAEAVSSVRVCPQCFTAERAGTTICAGCGYTYPIKDRTPKESEGELLEVTGSFKHHKATKTSAENGRTYTLEALADLGRMRGYKEPLKWAQHVIDARRTKSRRTA